MKCKNVSQVYFASEEVNACIVTCGGLCPGLNTVIREIVHSLDYMYGVGKVLGIDVSHMIIASCDVLGGATRSGAVSASFNSSG